MLKASSIIFVILFVVSFWTANGLYAQEGVQDVLEQLLVEAKSPERSLEQQNESVDSLIKESHRLGDNKYLCHGYLRKIIAAYNAYDFKELRRWVELLEPLALKEEEYDTYFRGKQCFVDLMLVEGDLEKGEQEALKMLSEAKSMDHQIGTILGHLCLSHAYSMSYRNSLAILELEEAYLISSEAEYFWVNQEILHALISNYGSLVDYKNQIKWLKKKEELLLERAKQNVDTEEAIKPTLNLVYTMFVNYYVRIGDATMAKQYMDASKNSFLDSFASVYKSFYYDAGFRYYEYMEDYSNALWCVDSLLSHASITSDQYAYQATKARILAKTGALKDAAELYEQAMRRYDTFSATVLNKQIEQIEQVEQNNRMLFEKARINNYINITLLFAVLVGLCMFIYYILHAIKVRDSLKSAEQEMRLMSQQMETANLAKDKFLSNIGQLISIPLNIIVTSSMELVSNNEMLPQRKDELSVLVRKTTQTLMMLINNILDLSRLEAGMMKFQMDEISPVAHIELLLESFSDRTVQLRCDIPQMESQRYTIEVDQTKFTQLLESVFTRNKPIFASISFKEDVMEIVVTGSDLSLGNFSQDIMIKNEINLLLIRNFKGDYVVYPEQSTIVITTPVILL